MMAAAQRLDDGDSDPEDILFTSLQTLYEYAPISHSSAGKYFTYSPKPSSLLDKSSPFTMTLTTPDTQPANWSLHASSIWASSIYLADNLADLQLEKLHDQSNQANDIFVLELGAGAGLPAILIAKIHHSIQVTVSDYPDELLISTLSDNVRRNGVDDRCRVVPYAWGSDASVLIHQTGGAGFDIVLSADALWNSELHPSFIDTLCKVLKKTTNARIHIIAGLHTGRYTIQAFIDVIGSAGLKVLSAVEKKIDGSLQREWCVLRAETENERERREWVVWMILSP